MKNGKVYLNKLLRLLRSLAAFNLKYVLVLLKPCLLFPVLQHQSFEK